MPSSLQALLGVEQRVAEVEVQLLRVVGPLEVPEQREVAALGRASAVRCSSCLSSEVLPTRRVPSSHSAVARAVEDLVDQRRAAVEALAAHPLADDEGDRRQAAHASSPGRRRPRRRRR